MAAKKMTSKKSRLVWLSLALAAVLVLVAIIVGASAQMKPAAVAGPTPEPAETSTSLHLDRRIPGDPLAMGSVDAPVVMVEYSDYRCPFCGVFARDSMPELVKEYVDAGQLRIEWRDLALFGEQSVRAAVAGRAAGAQEKFWEFNEAVYAAAPARGKPELSEAELVDLAKVAGVPDITQFTVDMKDPALAALVQADVQEAQQLGITGTPTFVINDQAISGAQPLAVFRSFIDVAVARAK